MESFYGGRQGISFIIVQRFDGIDIPQSEDNPVYTGAYYAVDPDMTNTVYLLCEGGEFITRNTLNYDKHSWEYFEHNGDMKDIKNIEDGNIGIKELKNELARGMKQCFEKGNSSTNEVNYGEYVIIDTIQNFNKYSDPDNGKVFRRGLVYNPDDIYGGAEYIGQIVGPQGECPEMDLTLEKKVQELFPDSYKQKKYSLSRNSETGGLVPGKKSNGAFVDAITYSYATVRDEDGNVKGCLLGFTFPYLVTEFVSEQVSPYNDEGHREDTSKFIRLDDTSHPFYEKWKLQIPEGVKGDCYENLRVSFYEFKKEMKIGAYNKDGKLVTLKKDSRLKDGEVLLKNIESPEGLRERKALDIWNETTQQYEPSDYKVALSNAYANWYCDLKNFDTEKDGIVTTYCIGPYNYIDPSATACITNVRTIADDSLSTNGLWFNYKSIFEADSTKTKEHDNIVKIIAEISKKRDNISNYDTYPIGTQARYISGVRNAGGNNIEEQFLLGFDCITTKEVDEDKNEIITQEFRKENITTGFYKVTTWNYAQPNYETSRHFFNNTELNLSKEDSDFNNVAEQLDLANAETFSMDNENKLNITQDPEIDIPIVSKSLLTYICDNGESVNVSVKYLYIAETKDNGVTTQKQVVKSLL